MLLDELRIKKFSYKKQTKECIAKNVYTVGAYFSFMYTHAFSILIGCVY